MDRSGGVYAPNRGGATSNELSSRLSWVKHFEKLRRGEKRGYVRAFPRRFLALQGLLAYVRVFRGVEPLSRFPRGDSWRLEAPLRR